MDKKSVNPFFSDRVIAFNQQFSNHDAVLKEVSNQLSKTGAVKSTFGEAIITREKNYPTGLQLNDGIGVAIPHTDANQVNHDQIGFVSLKQPVEFRQMASATDIVSVNYLFVLALKTAHQQLDMLQKLMGLFADDTEMAQFRKISSADELIRFMTDHGIA